MGPVAHGTARQLTSSGRSAIAAIQLHGALSQLDAPPSLFRAANLKRLDEQSIDTICFGVWGEPGEDVVVCRTGRDSVEVTCHGGAAAVARIMQAAAGRGFRMAAPQSVAGFSATGRPLSEKLVTDWRPLTQARTQRTAEILLEQASAWPKFVERLSHCPREEALRLIEGALVWSEFARHLTSPWSVVLCGRPNVGKSSLMNALAGFTRSIVSEQAGTTRDRVTLETAIDGWPVRITDTAGVRETSDAIEQAGVEQSLSAIALADLVVIVFDASEPVQVEDRRLLQVPAPRRLVVSHKSDLPRSTCDRLQTACIDVSSVTGQGLEALMRAITAALIPSLPRSDQPIPVSTEQESDLRSRRAEITSVS